MSDEPDPEIIADLQLRAATERDRNRTRRADYSWAPPVAVENWTCRVPRCGALVGVTVDVVEQLARFNGYLRSRAEREITTESVVLCDKCRAILPAYRSDAVRTRQARLAVTIRALKSSPNPRNEHELIQKLTADHHPDVTGLLESLAARLGEGQRRKGKA